MGASNFRQSGFSEELTSKLLSEDEKVLAMRIQKFPGRGNRTYKGPGL